VCQWGWGVRGSLVGSWDLPDKDDYYCHKIQASAMLVMPPYDN